MLHGIHLSQTSVHSEYLMLTSSKVECLDGILFEKQVAPTWSVDATAEAVHDRIERWGPDEVCGKMGETPNLQREKPFYGNRERYSLPGFCCNYFPTTERMDGMTVAC